MENDYTNPQSNELNFLLVQNVAHQSVMSGTIVSEARKLIR